MGSLGRGGGSVFYGTKLRSLSLIILSFVVGITPRKESHFCSLASGESRFTIHVIDILPNIRNCIYEFISQILRHMPGSWVRSVIFIYFFTCSEESGPDPWSPLSSTVLNPSYRSIFSMLKLLFLLSHYFYWSSLRSHPRSLLTIVALTPSRQ